MFASRNGAQDNILLHPNHASPRPLPSSSSPQPLYRRLFHLTTTSSHLTKPFPSSSPGGPAIYTSQDCLRDRRLKSHQQRHQQLQQKGNPPPQLQPLTLQPTKSPFEDESVEPIARPKQAHMRPDTSPVREETLQLSQEAKEYEQDAENEKTFVCEDEDDCSLEKKNQKNLQTLVMPASPEKVVVLDSPLSPLTLSESTGSLSGIILTSPLSTPLSSTPKKNTPESYTSGGNNSSDHTSSTDRGSPKQRSKKKDVEHPSPLSLSSSSSPLFFKRLSTPQISPFSIGFEMGKVVEKEKAEAVQGLNRTTACGEKKKKEDATITAETELKLPREPSAPINAPELVSEPVPNAGSDEPSLEEQANLDEAEIFENETDSKRPEEQQQNSLITGRNVGTAPKTVSDQSPTLPLAPLSLPQQQGDNQQQQQQKQTKSLLIPQNLGPTVKLLPNQTLSVTDRPPAPPAQTQLSTPTKPETANNILPTNNTTQPSASMSPEPRKKPRRNLGLLSRLLSSSSSSKIQQNDNSRPVHKTSSLSSLKSAISIPLTVTKSSPLSLFSSKKQNKNSATPPSPTPSSRSAESSISGGSSQSAHSAGSGNTNSNSSLSTLFSRSSSGSTGASSLGSGPSRANSLSKRKQANGGLGPRAGGKYGDTRGEASSKMVTMGTMYADRMDALRRERERQQHVNRQIAMQSRARMVIQQRQQMLQQQQQQQQFVQQQYPPMQQQISKSPSMLQLEAERQSMYGSSYYRGNGGVPKLRNLTGSTRDGGRGETSAGGNGMGGGSTRMSTMSMFEFDSIKEEEEIDELRKSWRGELADVCRVKGSSSGPGSGSGSTEHDDGYDGALDYYVSGSPNVVATTGNSSLASAVPKGSDARQTSQGSGLGICDKSSDFESSDDDDFDDCEFMDAVTGIPEKYD